MALPKYGLVSVFLNNFSLDNENKNAAGTAHDTVGQPGTHIPIIAKRMNNEPVPTYNLLLKGLLETQYFSTTWSTVSNLSIELRPNIMT